MSGRGTSKRGALFGIIATLAIVLSCGDIDGEEMKCEEAVLRIETCCEKIDVNRFNCVERQPGCGVQATQPAFTKTAAECIYDASCGDLQSKGICDGIRQLSYGPYPVQDRAAFEKEACR